MRLLKYTSVALSFISLSFTFAAVRPLNVRGLDQQYRQSANLLLKNLSPKDGHKGAILAAPSRSNPDYYYHWVRDAGLVVLALESIYLDPTLNNRNMKNSIKDFFVNHIYFNEIIQKTTFKHNGQGEPKFYVNGNPYLGPWGRPQNDGPALRSLSLTQLLGLSIHQKWPEAAAISSMMYRPEIPANSILKRDLEFVAHHWRESNFDLWEEVMGMHFYTLMAQRKSLYVGSMVAKAYKDNAASSFYSEQMKQISKMVESFWSPQKGYIEATRFTVRGRNKSHLDSAVLLGVLHSEIEGSAFSVPDARVLATFNKLKASFNSIYTINRNKDHGVAFGRYPEDTYDGYVTNSRGNPWVLTTAGAGEYLYRLVTNYVKTKKIHVDGINLNYFKALSGNGNLDAGTTLTPSQPEFAAIIKSLLKEADSYLARVLHHKNADGSLSEQINRETGFMQGAPHLTWSYASFATAKVRRDEAMNVSRNFLK